MDPAELVAVTRMSIGPVLPDGGVPVKVRVAAWKVSHDGIEPPAARLAE